MSTPVETLYAVTNATWPPASERDLGGVTLRDGKGGGKRVSAATWDSDAELSQDRLAEAEAAMRAAGQVPLFMVRAGESVLDAALEARGYEVVDPVNLYVGPLGPLMQIELPRANLFEIWEPLAIQKDIWAAGGIGPARIAVMERAKRPKTSIFARIDHTPAATAYVGVDQGIAMMHALEVVESCRRKGIGRQMVAKAALWAREQGASQMAVLCTVANTGANALYSSVGLSPVGQYHYRQAKE